MTYRPNGATLDTVQTVTGTKTFNTGKLLMTSPVAANVEPYSDANPPQTMDMTDFPQGSVTNPAAGLARLYTPDGMSLRMRDNSGADTLLGPSAGGADPLLLPTEYVTTTPTPPATGLTVFSRARTRRLLATVGPSGQDTSYQPALFANRVARINAINNATNPSLDGIAVTNVATPTAVNNASTNFYTSMVRTRYSSTATAGNSAGTRSSSTQWFMSTSPGLGGCFFVCRFGLGAISATNRLFIGLHTATANIANVNPSTLLNIIGFGCDSGQGTMRFFHNDGTGTATAVDLGSGFFTNSAATWFYEARIFIPSGAGQDVRWSMTRLNDGQYASGVATTDLPANGTMLAAHLWFNNGTTASAVSLDLQSLYVESDN